MTNYICAQWRDAVTDPPPDGWHGIYRYADGETVPMGHGLHHGGSWWTELEYQESRTPEPGDQWLDITTEAAIPATQVQAAVDYLVEQGLPFSADVAARLLGVTPTEVTP